MNVQIVNTSARLQLIYGSMYNQSMKEPNFYVISVIIQQVLKWA